MIPRFLYPLLPYRSLFLPVLVVGASTAACWFAFRLYRHRTSRHRPPLRRELVLLSFVVYLSGVAAATLLPNHNSRRAAGAAMGIDLHPHLASLTCSSAALPDGSPARAFCVRNAKGNVMLFVPLGILLPLVWPRLRFWRVVQIAVALSIGIEITQYLSRAWINRSTDVNDVILNGVGACLGFMLASLARSLRRSGSPVPRS